MSRSKTFAELASQDVSKTEFDVLDTTAGVAGVGTFLRGDKQWAAAGSTDAGDLDTGTLPAARLPAGSILQFAYDTDTGTHRSSATNAYGDLAGLSLELTSIKANSKFHLHFSSGMAYAPGASATLNIKRVIASGPSAGTTNELSAATKGMGYWDTTAWAPASISWTDSPSVEAEITVTYTLRFKNSSGTAYWLHSAAQGYGHIFEIGV